MSKEPIIVVADIIQNQLGLNPGQVMLAYQKYNIQTKGLFIVLSYVGPSSVIGGSDVFVDDAGIVVNSPYSPYEAGVPVPVPTGGLTEIQSITMLYEVQIDIMAFNNDDGTNDARTGKELVAMALSSMYSEQSQETNQLQVATHPGPFIDTSQLEETQFLQRYTTRMKITAGTTKTQPASFYNAFAKPQLVVNQ